MKDLHKIGFSTTSVEQRIKNAEKSPTYLMAPVKVVADYRLYNVKASWLEHLLHRVFAEVRLDLTQIDKKGRNYDPSEWFVVPYDVINQAVTMIMSSSAPSPADAAPAAETPDAPKASADAAVAIWANRRKL